MAGERVKDIAALLRPLGGEAPALLRAKTKDAGLPPEAREGRQADQKIGGKAPPPAGPRQVKRIGALAACRCAAGLAWSSADFAMIVIIGNLRQPLAGRFLPPAYRE